MRRLMPAWHPGCLTWCLSSQKPRGFSTSRHCPCPQKSAKTKLIDAVERRIQFSGPMSVAAYMTEILTHPASGYYMVKDVLGPQGDFVTSPEISQMFGELIALWCVNEWINAGAPAHFRFIELGPGRGTLVDDVCRVLARIPELASAVEIILVELSQWQRAAQLAKLTTGSHLHHQAEPVKVEDGISHKTRFGFPVTWYDHIDSVPSSSFNALVAHEFFDALPILKFQKDPEGRWREVFIDMDYSEDGPHHLRFVLNPNTSPSQAYLDLALTADDSRSHVEVSPAAGTLVQSVAKAVQDGGVALIADYGHEASKTDTLRSFKKHKLWNPLEEPGSADITADVDFAFLRRMVTQFGHDITTFGPVTQRQFLKEMAIDVRLSMLLEKADEEKQKDLISGYKMLTEVEQMGEKFKFFAIRQSAAAGAPVGFLNMNVDNN